ncbi:MAG: HK97 gp10 family phage protein [Aestuariibacter sp.]|nr:HK97 gp10 family phage protein [Aestuariibacter sp.]
MAGVEIKIEGLKDLNKSLHQIPVQLKKKVVVSSLREGAKVFQRTARQAAPRRSGRLRRAIKVKISRIHNKPRLGLFGLYIKINPGKKRDDMRGAYYGHIIDGGWNTRGKMPRNMIERAYARGEVVRDFGSRSGRKTPKGKTNVPGKQFMLKAWGKRTQATALSIKSMERGVDVVKRNLGF